MHAIIDSKAREVNASPLTLSDSRLVLSLALEERRYVVKVAALSYTTHASGRKRGGPIRRRKIILEHIFPSLKLEYAVIVIW